MTVRSLPGSGLHHTNNHWKSQPDLVSCQTWTTNSFEQRLTTDGWQTQGNRKAGRSRNKAPCPHIPLYPENLAEQFRFSFCLMSPYNKSCDLRWPERLCLSPQPKNLLSQLKETAKWLVTYIQGGAPHVTLGW